MAGVVSAGLTLQLVKEIAMSSISVGQVFGGWKVRSVEYGDRGGPKNIICQCECGNERMVKPNHLRAGVSQSCGCRRDEMVRKKLMKPGVSTGYINRGGKRTPEYNTWRAMKDRCTRPKHSQYADYGGRGIKVCDWWQDFQNFLADMGKRPKGTSIDRIDNDGDYEPGNCRWATRTEQNRKRRSSRMITAFGKTMCVTEWAEELGVSQSVLSGRLNRYGWSEERALATPLLNKGPEGVTAMWRGVNNWTGAVK